MKKNLLIELILSVIPLLSISQIPYKQPSFADNIVIQDLTERNQRNVGFCSANNGRLFSAYSYYDPAGSGISMLYSDDEGLSWTPFQDLGIFFPPHEVVPIIQTLANDDSQGILKLYRLLMVYDSISFNHSLSLVAYNGSTLAYMNDLDLSSNYHVHDAAIASDNLFPAVGSNPYSLAAAKTMTVGSYDELSILTSSNGGSSMTSNTVVRSVYMKYLGEVDLSYGRCLSYPEGRYFVVWEEKDSSGSMTGHLYTSYSISGYYGDYSTPIKLDDFLPASDGLLCNPRISCQVGSNDNDSANLTEVILADLYNPVTNSFQIVGFYSEIGVGGTTFQTFKIGDSTHNCKQASISFNPYDSNFFVSYFDSTEKKLPYLTHSCNFSDPVSWTVADSGFNNSANITNPYPQVGICYNTHSAGVTWSMDNSTGNGVGLYDAASHYYTGVQDSYDPESNHTINIYPNPSSDAATARFTVATRTTVSLEILDQNGRVLQTPYRGTLDQGEYRWTLNTGTLPAGIYLVSLTSGSERAVKKIVIIR